jgi:hypothetical protein
MNCKQIQELIQDHLDMSLPNERKKQLERHLDSCSECREEFARYRKILDILETEEQIEPPKNFVSRVMNSLPEIDFKSSGSEVTGILSKLRQYKWHVTAGMAIAAALVVGIIPEDTNKVSTEGTPAEQMQLAKRIPIEQPAQPTNPVDDEILVQPAHQQNIQLAKLTLDVDSGVVKVTGEDGDIQHVRSGQTVELDFRDEIETGFKTSAKITYPEDNVRLSLKAGSRMQIARSSVRLYYGDTWVHVVKKGTRFEVQTPNLIAAVRGTVFATEVNYSTSALFGDFSWYMGETDGLKYNDSMAASFHIMKNSLDFLYTAKQPDVRKSTVSVFEGVVGVTSLENPDKDVELTMGQSVSNVGKMLAKRTPIGKSVYDKWSDENERDMVPVPETAGKRTPLEKRPEEGNNTPLNTEINPEDAFNQIDK